MSYKCDLSIEEMKWELEHLEAYESIKNNDGAFGVGLEPLKEDWNIIRCSM